MRGVAPTGHALRVAENSERELRKAFQIFEQCGELLVKKGERAPSGSTRPMTRGVTTVHDAAGRVTGKARTDSNGGTTFHDRAGRVTGTARTDRNGVTTFRDAAGRTTGSIRK
jgi:hypothetical protein